MTFPYNGLMVHEGSCQADRVLGGGSFDESAYISSFPGKVLIQDRIPAMKYALDEHGERVSWNNKLRMALWVDRSTDGKRSAGIAVVYKENCRAASSR